MHYTHTVRLRDTDAAGVIYFSRVLDLCHAAYEHTLQTIGVDLHRFFRNPDTAIPLVHASVDFLRPIFCGDQLDIHVTGQQLTEDEFELHYQLFVRPNQEKPVSQALTRHVCIHPTRRQRQPLPSEIQQWLQHIDQFH